MKNILYTQSRYPYRYRDPLYMIPYPYLLTIRIDSLIRTFKVQLSELISESLVRIAGPQCILWVSPPKYI